jgi:beta-mannosidase
MDFDGKVLLDESQAVEVAPLSSQVYLEWPLYKLTQAGAADTSRGFVVAELTASGATISRNLLYLAPVKEVHLKPAVLKIEVSKTDPLPREKSKFTNKYQIEVTSPVLARSVYLAFGDLDAESSDNYFDVLPGETVAVSVRSSASLDAVKAQLKVVSLTDAFADSGQSATVSAVKKATAVIVK